MTDYQCPSCSGGFPATAATDDECPWCGEAMDGDSDGALSHLPPQHNVFQQPIEQVRDRVSTTVEQRKPSDRL